MIADAYLQSRAELGSALATLTTLAQDLRAPGELSPGRSIVGVSSQERADALRATAHVGGVPAEEEAHLSRRDRGAR